MKREIMWSLTELENALVSEGVPEDVAADLVDSFETAVEECLEKHQDEAEDADDDVETEDADEESADGDESDDDCGSSEDDGCEHRKGGYRVG